MIRLITLLVLLLSGFWLASAPAQSPAVPAEEASYSDLLTLGHDVSGFRQYLQSQSSALDPEYLQRSRYVGGGGPIAIAPSADVHSAIKRRVVFALKDFYSANDEPLVLCMLNIGTYHLPVKKIDLEKLADAMSALKAYETSTLKPLLKEEQAIVAKEVAVVDQIIAIHKEEAAIQARIAPLWAAAPLTEHGPLEEQLRQAIDAAGKNLPNLSERWNALDQQDQVLAQTYVRRVFTLEIPDLYRGSNLVTPLVDGSSVYPRIDQLLTDVARNGGQSGYVHISLWWCQANTPLMGGRTFAQAIQAVANSGAEVRLTLWNGSYLEEWRGPFQRHTADNRACKATLEKFGKNVKVELLVHANHTGAYHEKYFVFYDGSSLRAIVGGLNMDSGELSTPGHATSRTPDQWRDVHDVAVEIAGPAAADVDADFGAHWYSPWVADANITPTPANFAIPGAEDVKITVTHPLVNYSYSSLSTFKSPPSSIQNELLERINAARKYIYIENYAVYDEDVVAALGKRISEEKRAGRIFPVILLLHHVTGPGVYNYLHFITYQHLSFMGCDGFTYTDDQGIAQHVDRHSQGKQIWSVGRYAGDFYEKTRVQWDGGSALLTSITTFDGDHPLYALVSLAPGGGPAPYLPTWVHSKVSIFDDEYAGIGSANFNPRSMLDDGELAAFVHGKAAATLRKQLWTEYTSGKVPAPKDFDAVAQANVASKGAGQAGKLFVIQLHGKDFSSGDFFVWLSKQSFGTAHLSSARYY